MQGLAERSSDADRLAEAHRLMSRALDILDDDGVRGDVGSHLDLAISRLEQLMGIRRGDSDHALLTAVLESMAVEDRSAEVSVSPWSLDSSDVTLSPRGTLQADLPARG